MDVFGIILPIVYILAGCALVWFIIELALTIRKVRSTVTDLKDQVDPALANVNRITNQLPPIIDKVDPIMDRVTLTVDSVNLELMRVDELLEDVTQITGTVSKATTAVDNVTSAPLDIVANMTNKVRGLFKPKYASQQTADIGVENANVPENPIVEFASAAATAAGDAVREQRDIRAERKQAAQVKQDAASARNQTMSQTATTITDEVLAHAQADAPDAQTKGTVKADAPAPASIPHENPIDPSLYVVADAVEEAPVAEEVVEEIVTIEEVPVTEVVEEPLADAGSVRVSGDILMNMETGSIDAVIEDTNER